jgi:hypothetical protein
VGAGGVEPPAPSVSAKHREPLCSAPFSQVGPDRRGGRETLSWRPGKRSLSNRLPTLGHHYITPLAAAIQPTRSVETPAPQSCRLGVARIPHGTPLSWLSQQTRAARASMRPRQPGPSRHRPPVAAASLTGPLRELRKSPSSGCTWPRVPRRNLTAGLAGGHLPRSGAVRISSYFRTL